MSDFPLAAAAAFFYHLKHAEEYAPPDVTGELEGQFLAPKNQVVDAIVQLIQNELKTGIAYQFYANTLRDLSRNAIAEEFLDHASEEAEHAEWLMQRLAVLAGTAQLPDIPSPPPVTDALHIIQTMIRIEQEGIAKWRLLRSLIGDENPMRFKVEEYLTREQHHLDELWQLLPHTPDMPGQKTATALPRMFSKELIRRGHAGELAPELQEAFTEHVRRNKLIGTGAGAVTGAAAGGAVGYTAGSGVDDETPTSERAQNAAVGALAGGGIGALLGRGIGRFGTRKIPGLNKALVKAREAESAGDVSSLGHILKDNTEKGREALLDKLDTGFRNSPFADHDSVRVHELGTLADRPLVEDLLYPTNPNALRKLTKEDLRGHYADLANGASDVNSRVGRKGDDLYAWNYYPSPAPDGISEFSLSTVADGMRHNGYMFREPNDKLTPGQRIRLERALHPREQGSEPDVKVATALPTDFASMLRSAGRSGQLAEGLQKSFDSNLMRNQLIGAGVGAVGGGALGALSADTEKGESRLARGTIGALGGAGVGFGVGRFGTRKIPGLNKALEGARTEGGIRPLLASDAEREQILKRLSEGSKDFMEQTQGRAPNTHFTRFGAPGDIHEPDLLHGVDLKAVTEASAGDVPSRFFPSPSYAAGHQNTRRGVTAELPKSGPATFRTEPHTVDAIPSAGLPMSDTAAIAAAGNVSPPNLPPQATIGVPAPNQEEAVKELWRLLGKTASGASEQEYEDLLSRTHLSNILRDGAIGGTIGSDLVGLATHAIKGNNAKAQLAALLAGAGVGAVGGGIHGHRKGKELVQRIRDRAEGPELDYNLARQAIQAGLIGHGILTNTPSSALIAAGDMGLQMNGRRAAKMRDMLGKEAASYGQDPTIPATLTPSNTGSLAEMLSGVDRESQQMEELPEIPEDVSPEEIDPALLMQLNQEEQGRVQEADAAAQYFQAQAQQTQQQMQMMQQQLEQQAQQAQTLQMQLQQEQMQRQQAQQMAQQSADTATLALQQQLQMQQSALQSRQLSTAVLQQHDGLKQQIMELVNPPPPPPAPPADPAAQAVGALPQQQQQGSMVPAPQGAAPEAPKTASDEKGESPWRRGGAGVAAATLTGKMVLDGVSQYNKYGPAYAALNTGLPAALTVAEVAYAMRDGMSGVRNRAAQSAQSAHQALQSAEAAYNQERSYTNATRLVGAKTQAAAAELNRDFPEAGLVASAAGTYAAGKGVAAVGQKVKRLADFYRNKNKPELLRPSPREAKEF